MYYYLPRTKKEAKEIGSKFYFTGKFCKHHHLSIRYSYGDCVVCQKIHGKSSYMKHKNDPLFLQNRKEYLKKYNEENREIIKIKQSEYARKNAEIIKQNKQRYYKETKEIFKLKYDLYYLENKETILIRNKNYRDENKEIIYEKKKQWIKNNPEKVSASSRRSRDKKKEYYKEYGKKHREENKASYTRYSSTRRANELEAIPVWLKNDPSGMKLILDIYTESQAYKKVLNIDTHVDHIVPLKGKRRLDDKGKMVHVVCGLHTPANLQIIYGQDNISKNCYQWPDM